MNRQEFRNLQREAGVRVAYVIGRSGDRNNSERYPEGECPACGSAAVADMECEDCGTDFKKVKLG